MTRRYTLGFNTCVPNGDIIQHIYSFAHEDGRDILRIKECEVQDGKILTDSINTREEVYVPSDPSNALSESILINVNGQQYNTIENARRLYKYLLKEGFQPFPNYLLDK